MITINPYIYFDGNCEEAFKYYESVFRKKISHISKYKDTPVAQRNIFQEPDEKVMHATLPLCKEIMLNGSDLGLGHSAGDNVMGSISMNRDGIQEGDIAGIRQIYGE